VCIAFIDATPKPNDSLFGDYGCVSPWLLRLRGETLLRQLTMQLSLTLGIRRTFIYGRGAEFRDQSFGDLIIHPWPGGMREALRFVSLEYPSKRVLLIDRPLPFAQSIALDTLLCLAHYRGAEEAIAIQTRAQAQMTFPDHSWEFHREQREIGLRVFSPSRLGKLITDDVIQLPVLCDLGFSVETPGDYEYAKMLIAQSKVKD
jgi:hypothetical protein